MEGKKATARVVAYLPSTASDPYIVDGTPRELWRVQYLDSQLKGDTQDLEEEELECSEPSWTAPSFGKAKKKAPPPKKEKVTGVVAAGTKVRVTDPRFAGETGIVNGYRDGWHVVTLDADGSGAKFVRLKHLQRADGAPLVLDDVADATAPASPRVKAAASKPNVGAFASGGGIGRWTPDEDAALRRLHAEHSNTRNKWDVIAAAIGTRRTASAAENRWFIIKNAPAAPAAAEQPGDLHDLAADARRAGAFRRAVRGGPGDGAGHGAAPPSRYHGGRSSRRVTEGRLRYVRPPRGCQTRVDHKSLQSPRERAHESKAARRVLPRVSESRRSCRAAAAAREEEARRAQAGRPRARRPRGRSRSGPRRRRPRRRPRSASRNGPRKSRAPSATKPSSSGAWRATAGR